MDLFAKAEELGILTEFTDVHGRLRVIDPEPLQSIIEALPAPAAHSFLRNYIVLRPDHDRPAQPIKAVLIGKLPVSWRIFRNCEVLAQGQSTEESIVVPAGLPMGLYQLVLTDASGAEEQATLVVAPQKAFAGEFDRRWLLTAQLYGIRSTRNWGIGDFGDLKLLIELAGQLGADGVGLNPLHALFSDRPLDCSPYSPNSRLFLNPLYIHVEAIPGFEGRFSSENNEAIARLREKDVVDYGEVARLKWLALRSAFAAFRTDASTASQRDFESFRAERAAPLARFACFEVLRQKFKQPWWEWPEEWRQPDDARLARLRAGLDRAEIEFIEFVQWTADRQLASCREHAVRLGMKVGLYLDVAVGVRSDGFDAWNEQLAISPQLAVGAPPDALNTAGQDWGLAGFNAAGLEIRSFEPFRDMLCAAMRHAGAVRLDHVLGLKRLYLIPRGFGPGKGAYVRMPFEALLAVTALESIAHHCVVVGEDLGTVPEGFREQMADWGIWSYKVMIFERDAQGRFQPADQYDRDALVTFSTHDLSTYAGWRSLSDLKQKKFLGIDPGESDESRRHALAMLEDILNGHGIERDDLYGVVKFLSDSKSRLLTIALEDLLGVVDQPNVPGTIDEYPNWRRRLPVALEDVASVIDVAALKNATGGRQKARSDLSRVER